MVFTLHGITKSEIQTSTGDSVCMVEFVERGRVIDMTIYTDHLKETVIGTTAPYQKSSLEGLATMKNVADRIIRECNMSADDASFVQEQISFITGYYEAPTDKPSDDPSEFRGCKIPAPYRMLDTGVHVEKINRDTGDIELKMLTSTPLSISGVGMNVDNQDQWAKVYLETALGQEFTGWR